MTIRGVEQDIESAVVDGIVSRLSTDGVTGVTVDGLTIGAPGEEPQKPYVFVMCRPLEAIGGGTLQWTGDMTIEIMTQHLTDEDRDAQTMVDIFKSVAFALDFDDFSPNLDLLGSLQVRRIGGEYEFSDSTNTAMIEVRVIKACGSQ